MPMLVFQCTFSGSYGKLLFPSEIFRKNHRNAYKTKTFKCRFMVYKLMATFTAIIQKEENMYVAKCPEIGTASQGRTIEEAISNLKEATELYIEEFPTKGSPKPIVTTFEVAQVGKA